MTGSLYINSENKLTGWFWDSLKKIICTSEIICRTIFFRKALPYVLYFWLWAQPLHETWFMGIPMGQFQQSQLICPSTANRFSPPPIASIILLISSSSLPTPLLNPLASRSHSSSPSSCWLIHTVLIPSSSLFWNIQSPGLPQSLDFRLRVSHTINCIWITNKNTTFFGHKKWLQHLGFQSTYTVKTIYKIVI